MIPREAAIQLYIQRRKYHLTLTADSQGLYIGYQPLGDDDWEPDIEVIRCQWCKWVSDVVQGQNPQPRTICSGCRDLINADLMDAARSAFDDVLEAMRAAEELQRIEAEKKSVRSLIVSLDKKYPLDLDVVSEKEIAEYAVSQSLVELEKDAHTPIDGLHVEHYEVRRIDNYDELEPFEPF